MKSRNASKYSLKKPKSKPPRPPTPTPADPWQTTRTRWGILALVLLVTAAVFLPALANGFVNWDDGEHLLENPYVRSLAGENLVRIFRQRVLKTYVPLTVLSYVLEYRLFGYHPFPYHFVNLALHLAVTAMVFFLVLRLGFSPVTAGLTAVLFAIHPMRVESVAWISQRKDVLYAFFYLLALHQYLSFLEKGKVGPFLLSVGFGMLSALAKPMAMSLPLVLLLLDWWKGRRWSWPLFWEKFPHLAYVVPLAALAVVDNKTALAAFHSLGEAVLIALWCLTFYPQKFLFPLTLSPIYVLPQPVTLGNPVYLWSLIFLFLAAVLLWLRRGDRLLRFAFLFYFASIFFLLRYNDLAHLGIVNDRFFYLPGLGFALWIADLISRRISSVKRDKFYRFCLGGIVFLIMVGLGMKTFTQNRTWKDGGTLWRQALRVAPDNSRANSNLADHLLREDINSDEVLRLCRKAIALDPEFADARVNLGTLLGRRKDYDGAIEQFRKAVELDPGHAVAHANLGTAYTQKAELERAAFHFEKACDLGFCPPPMQANLESIRKQLKTTDVKDQ